MPFCWYHNATDFEILPQKVSLTVNTPHFPSVNWPILKEMLSSFRPQKSDLSFGFLVKNLNEFENLNVPTETIIPTFYQYQNTQSQ